METHTSRTNSSMVVRARRAGTVDYVDASRIEIGTSDDLPARSSSASTTERHLPEPEADRPDRARRSRKGEVIADGAGTYQGELALGRNVLVAFMAWDGFNFEDAIIISEELVEDDTLHLDPHRGVRRRDPRDEAGPRGVHPRHPQRQRESRSRNLDENGIVRVGTYVRPGDILVGKVSPKCKTELTPEEKLLHAIFGGPAKT